MVERGSWGVVDEGKVASLRNSAPLSVTNNRIQVLLGLVSFSCHKAISSSSKIMSRLVKSQEQQLTDPKICKTVCKT